MVPGMTMSETDCRFRALVAAVHRRRRRVAVTTLDWGRVPTSMVWWHPACAPALSRQDAQPAVAGLARRYRADQVVSVAGGHDWTSWSQLSRFTRDQDPSGQITAVKS
jgi:hypothetical protein